MRLAVPILAAAFNGLLAMALAVRGVELRLYGLHPSPAERSVLRCPVPGSATDESGSKVRHKLVYDTVMEKRFHTCYKTVTETSTKQVCRTCYKEECRTEMRPCTRTFLKDVVETRRVSRPEDVHEESAVHLLQAGLSVLHEELRVRHLQAGPRACCEKECIQTVCKQVCDPHCRATTESRSRSARRTTRIAARPSASRSLRDALPRRYAPPSAEVPRGVLLRQGLRHLLPRRLRSVLQDLPRNADATVCSMKCVTKKCGLHPGLQSVVIPGKCVTTYVDQCEQVVDPCCCKTTCCCKKVPVTCKEPDTTCQKKVYREKCVTEQVPCTTYVSKTVICEKVPYTVTRKESFTCTKDVPYTTSRTIRSACRRCLGLCVSNATDRVGTSRSALHRPQADPMQRVEDGDQSGHTGSRPHVTAAAFAAAMSPVRLHPPLRRLRRPALAATATRRCGTGGEAFDCDGGPDLPGRRHRSQERRHLRPGWFRNRS